MDRRRKWTSRVERLLWVFCLLDPLVFVGAASPVGSGLALNSFSAMPTPAGSPPPPALRVCWGDEVFRPATPEEKRTVYVFLGGPTTAIRCRFWDGVVEVLVALVDLLGS